MQVLIIVLYTAVVIVAVMLIGLILIQQSKGGLGGSFGSMSESVLGAHATTHLKKATVWLIGIFMVLTLSLAIISGRAEKETSTVEKVNKYLKEEAEAEEADAGSSEMTKEEAVPSLETGEVEVSSKGKKDDGKTPKAK